MRHIDEFNDWLFDFIEAYVNRPWKPGASLDITKAVIDALQEDWRNGRDPVDMLDAVMEGRHLHVKLHQLAATA